MSRIHMADSQYKALNPSYVNAPTLLTLSNATNALSTALAVGFYLIKSDADMFIKQGGSTLSAATTDWKLESGVVYPMAVNATGTDDNVAGILSSGSGTLQILAVP